MKLFYVILLFFSAPVFAGPLLLPSPEIDFEKYKASCGPAKYLCTTDYFVNYLRSHKTREFDQLMDEVDINSPKFRIIFQNKIIPILNSEELDRAQLAMLIQLLQQMNSQQHIVFFQFIENELKRIQSVIDKSAHEVSTSCQKEFVLFFKEIIPLEVSEQLRTTFLKIPLYHIHFASLPVRTNSSEFNRPRKNFLVADNCGVSNFDLKVKTVKFCSTKSEISENDPPVIRARYD